MKKSLILFFLFILLIGMSNGISSSTVLAGDVETCYDVDDVLSALAELYAMDGTVPCQAGEVYQYPKSFDIHLAQLDYGCDFSINNKVNNALAAIMRTANAQLACYDCEVVVDKLENLIAIIENFECTCED